MSVSSTFCPHSGQNLALGLSGAAHFLHCGGLLSIFLILLISSSNLAMTFSDSLMLLHNSTTSGSRTAPFLNCSKTISPILALSVPITFFSALILAEILDVSTTSDAFSVKLFTPSPILSNIDIQYSFLSII